MRVDLVNCDRIFCIRRYLWRYLCWIFDDMLLRSSWLYQEYQEHRCLRGLLGHPLLLLLMCNNMRNDLVWVELWNRFGCCKRYGWFLQGCSQQDLGNREITRRLLDLPWPHLREQRHPKLYISRWLLVFIFLDLLDCSGASIDAGVDSLEMRRVGEHCACDLFSIDLSFSAHSQVVLDISSEGYVISVCHFFKKFFEDILSMNF